MKKLLFTGALFPFLIFYSVKISLPSIGAPIKIYSNHLRDDLRRITLKTLCQAKQSITIHTYALTDHKILHLLQKKAENGVTVDVFYHKKNKVPIKKPLKGNLCFHPISGKGLMHEKWIVIDEAVCLFGTANLTPSSLSMHDNLLLGLHCPDLAKALSKGKSTDFKQVLGDQKFELFLLPHPKALSKILEALESAKQRIAIALFTFTHPDIVQKLIELRKRGVHIELYLDRYTAKGASSNALKQLKEAGVSTYLSQGLPLFHHKWAVIDSKMLVLGSANWTQAAFKKNTDFVCFLYPISQKEFQLLNRILSDIKDKTLKVSHAL